MVTTGRSAIVLEHVVLLEVPFVAKATENPLEPRLCLTSRSSVNEEAIDCDWADANGANDPRV